MFESVRLSREPEPAPAVTILAMYEGETPSLQSSPLLSELTVRNALTRAEWTGKPENSVEAFLPPVEEYGKERRVLIVGLGPRDKFNTETFRKVVANVARRVAATKETTVAIELASALSDTTLNAASAGEIVGETFGLLTWNPRLYQGKDAPPSTKVALTLTASGNEFADGVEWGLSLAASVNFARDLSQTPPNVATPLWMAVQAEKLAEEVGLSCRIIQGAELETERLTGLVNVGKASINPPCLIRLEYRPTGKTTENEAAESPSPVVLLGKTITYDTGGLSLKVNNGMVGMKRDKDGGCAVLGAMRAVATVVKPDFPVVGLLVAAENSVSESAFRPDDVLTYRNGVTVEVTNTDAEGRLVLADGLVWACEVEKAARIVDLATLTGGVVVALGSTYAGLFCDDDALRADLEAASATSGERIWRLPLHSEYREMMKSPVADLANSNPNRKAHPIQGAAFLSAFVTEGTPWAHIDIAGVHAVDSDTGPFVKGPTGWGVRLLAALLSA